VGSANIVLYDDDDNSIADLVLNPGLKTEVSRPCPGGAGDPPSLSCTQIIPALGSHTAHPSSSIVREK
jgi:hypothetical protein